LKPEGEDELAGADFAKFGNRNGCTTGEGGGELLSKGEKGFESASMLDNEGVVGGVVLGQGGGRFALDGKSRESQGEERKEDTDHF
jgi:hypothetical protein